MIWVRLYPHYSGHQLFIGHSKGCCSYRTCSSLLWPWYYVLVNRGSNLYPLLPAPAIRATSLEFAWHTWEYMNMLLAPVNKIMVTYLLLQCFNITQFFHIMLLIPRSNILGLCSKELALRVGVWEMYLPSVFPVIGQNYTILRGGLAI